VGVGPGDPDLMTIKAARILRQVSCICVPRGREEGSSLALSIIEGVVDLSGKDIVEAYFPMKKTRSDAADDELPERWNETAANILKRLEKGIDVAFITIGDPTIYSTFFYLYDRLMDLKPDIFIDIIPGVSSITAAAARSGISLGLADEKIAIIPAAYAGDLGRVLSEFDTVVLMKVNRVFDTVSRYLTEAGLAESAVYISKAGMREEAVIRGLGAVRKEDLSYFSLIIARRQARG